ncbi:MULTISPECIES: ABC transporter permease [Brenneria]|uniref:ABC transporter permease n=1 Tax=Brenneria nigrifluens DSM 30175 = ATCC 13028 TaxID=1121120 RepID=A0A2U1USX6_9GAMM|nr:MULTISPECIES: ABC transporter permease [Brenneria]EHD21704.1 ABC-type transporter, integral membrane subunit [Brenneria sp. EniD312]PWC24759.1 ABC transporter permease [Brenneria nigrifluens] [Brenneria nigrifluens DSM 30175 = ATCC 13028]QCR04818.1 ABC transporter permease [Brenneria nigrifluens] [Brenneria nigrifluens DSM 30175 = ATCC 13028]
MSQLDSSPVAAENQPARRSLKRFRKTGIIIGGGILLLMIAIALLAPWLAPYDPIAQDLDNRLALPFWQAAESGGHWLGTDQLGRDYLSRLLYGTRISLGIGIGVVVVAGVIGTSLGVLAGYFGGRVDMLISFLITTRLSLPIVLVALAAVALKGASIMTLVTILGLLVWDQFAIVTRARTQSLRNEAFVRAARAVGASHVFIMLREILPNLRNTIIVIATLEVANVILLESALSFLGLGVRPPTPSWGLMIAEGRDNILFESWLIALPGGALCLLVLAVNLFGDGLRDVMGAGVKR